MTNKSTKQPEPGFPSLRPTVRALALAGALSLTTAVWAQAVPFEAEGVVTDISTVQEDGSVNLMMFGRWMKVPATAYIHTPTKTITPADLADRTRFPGRTGFDQEGFIGGTAILVGEVDGTGEPAISDVTIEPGETVLLGAVSANDAGAIKVLGIPLVESTDWRMPSEGVRNEFGFFVIPATIPVGVLAAVEGYYAADGNFHHFLVEAGGGELVDPSTPQSSILRARCDTGGRLEVQGATYLPANNTVDFYNKHGFYFGSIATTLDLEAPQFGTYRFRTDVNAGEVDSDGACPSEVRAVTRVSSTTSTASVDGVVAPPAPPVDNGLPPVATGDTATIFRGLATEVDILVNDTDPDGDLDPTTVQFIGVPDGLAVQMVDGEAQITVTGTGSSYSFSYTVADLRGNVSEPATVSIGVQDVSMDTVDITRANFRTSKDRWEARGTTNIAGAVITVTLVRTNQQIATVTSDATGGWAIDVRNSQVVPTSTDTIRASSSGGGSDESGITISR